MPSSPAVPREYRVDLQLLVRNAELLEGYMKPFTTAFRILRKLYRWEAPVVTYYLLLLFNMSAFGVPPMFYLGTIVLGIWFVILLVKFSVGGENRLFPPDPDVRVEPQQDEIVDKFKLFLIRLNDRTIATARFCYRLHGLLAFRSIFKSVRFYFLIFSTVGMIHVIPSRYVCTAIVTAWLLHFQVSQAGWFSVLPALMGLKIHIRREEPENEDDIAWALRNSVKWMTADLDDETVAESPTQTSEYSDFSDDDLEGYHPMLDCNLDHDRTRCGVPVFVAQPPPSVVAPIPRYARRAIDLGPAADANTPFENVLERACAPDHLIPGSRESVVSQVSQMSSDTEDEASSSRASGRKNPITRAITFIDENGFEYFRADVIYNSDDSDSSVASIPPRAGRSLLNLATRVRESLDEAGEHTDASDDEFISQDESGGNTPAQIPSQTAAEAAALVAAQVTARAVAQVEAQATAHAAAHAAVQAAAQAVFPNVARAGNDSPFYEAQTDFPVKAEIKKEIKGVQSKVQGIDEKDAADKDGKDAAGKLQDKDGKDAAGKVQDKDGKDAAGKLQDKDGKDAAGKPQDKDGEDGKDTAGKPQDKDAAGKAQDKDGKDATGKPQDKDGKDAAGKPQDKDGKDAAGKAQDKDGKDATGKVQDKDGKDATGKPQDKDGKAAAGKPQDKDGKDAAGKAQDKDGKDAAGKAQDKDGKAGKVEAKEGKDDIPAKPQDIDTKVDGPRVAQNINTKDGAPRKASESEKSAASSNNSPREESAQPSTSSSSRTSVVGKLLELRRYGKNTNETCHSCSFAFSSIFKRKRLCTSCGNTYCARCCFQKLPKAALGVTAPEAQLDLVLVCCKCYALLTHQTQ